MTRSLALVFVLAACTASQPSPKAPVAPPATASTAPPPAAPPPTEPAKLTAGIDRPAAAVELPAVPRETTVTLLAPGKAPRHELRYAPQVGDVSRVEVIVHGRGRRTFDKTVVPEHAFSTVRYVLELRVAAVTPGGEVSLDLLVVEAEALETPDVTAQAQAEIARGLAALKGLAGQARVTARGFLVERGFTRPPSLRQDLAEKIYRLEDLLALLTTALPAEAVGEGARWRVAEKTSLGGLAMNAVSELTLVGGFVETATQGVVPEQDMPSPRMNYVHIAAMTLTRHARTRLDLRHVVPGEQTAEADIATRLWIDDGHKRIDLSSDSHETVELRAIR